MIQHNPKEKVNCFLHKEIFFSLISPILDISTVMVVLCVKKLLRFFVHRNPVVV